MTTTKFTIKINGEGHGCFAGKRGLRQGGHIFSLLFVLVMEYLSRTLKTISMLPDFKFHPMCKGLQLTHLIFADDFCKGNVSSVNSVMKVLGHFSKVLGLTANMDKSNIFIAKVKEYKRPIASKNMIYTLGITYQVSRLTSLPKEME